MQHATRSRVSRRKRAVLVLIASLGTQPSGMAVADDTPAKPGIEGWVVIGHEVRTFTPCSRTSDLWLTGEASVQKAIAQAYAGAATGKRPYLPVFMELTGRLAPRPGEGFGTRYSGAFEATGIVAARPGRICSNDRLVLQKPAAGDVVRSPLEVRGRARASWFSDGKLLIALLDARGKPLAQGAGLASGAPDGRDFVAFEGVLEFAPQRGERGTLVIMENDPSKSPGSAEASNLPLVLR